MDDAILKGSFWMFCHNFISPYANESISDLGNKGRSPQLLLEPVNIDAIYAQHLENNEGATVN